MRQFLKVLWCWQLWAMCLPALRVGATDTIPPYLAMPVFRFDSTARKPARPNEPYIGISIPQNDRRDAFSASGLRSNGSLTRSISVGNAQSLFVNSSLNLQLSGKIAGDVELNAAISDRNTPLQPEGNTRTLQEFDRVFVSLRRKGASLTAGDYDLLRPQSHFATYQRRLQGATARWQWARDSVQSLDIQGSVAAARGRFARNNIQGIEGNQGPYRLVGADGEKFIIVLAGSERVFIDGLPMQRGADADYIVDYNRGDITFTSRRLITKDSRIAVEFEFTSQQYLRSITEIRGQYRYKKHTFHALMFSEQDSRTPFNAGTRDTAQLTSELNALKNAGDFVDSLFVLGYDTVAFAADRVLYALADSLVGDSTYQILRYSTNTDSARYAARFLELGANKGHYIPLVNTANGIAFQWVAPDITGSPQGTHEPLRKVTAPVQRQLFTAGWEWHPSINTNFAIETAISRTDLNRLSNDGNSDNIGGAVMMRWRHRQPISDKWEAVFSGQYEGVQATFRVQQPYRNQEFARDWNLDPTLAPALEHVTNAAIGVTRDTTLTLLYEPSAYLRGVDYRALRHGWRTGFRRNSWAIQSSGNFQTAQSPAEQSEFLRPRFEISRQKKSFKTTLYAEAERNLRYAADTLSKSSFGFAFARYSLSKTFGKSTEIGGAYLLRRDWWAADSLRLAPLTDAQEWSLYGKSDQQNNHRLLWNLTRRDLVVYADSTETVLRPQQNYLGRIDYSGRFWKDVLTLNSVYELGTGQEQRIVWQYRQVAPGIGDFVWEDDGDGIIEQNEVYPATPATQAFADVVRFTELTNQFVRTQNMLLNQSLLFEPFGLIKGKKKIHRWLRMTSIQSSLLLNRRVLSGSGLAAWSPFSAADSNLVAINTLQRHVLQLWRGHTRHNVQFGYTHSRQRALLYSGFDERGSRELFARWQWTPNTQWQLQQDLSRYSLESNADATLQRTYLLQGWRYEPQLQYQASKSARIAVVLRLKNGINGLAPFEQATLADIGLEGNINKTATQLIRAKVSWVEARFTGNAGTAAAFALLDGFRPGRNYVWQIGIDRAAGKSLQIGFQYEGRYAVSGRTLHKGTMSARVLF